MPIGEWQIQVSGEGRLARLNRGYQIAQPSGGLFFDTLGLSAWSTVNAVLGSENLQSGSTFRL
jgi:hypothetical protein